MNCMGLLYQFIVKLVCRLKPMNSVTVKLQSRKLSVGDAQALLNHISGLHPQMHVATQKYLSPTSSIVHSTNFISGALKIIDGKENQLNQLEKNVMRPFKKPQPLDNAIDEDNQDAQQDAVEAILKKRKAADAHKSEYYNLEFVPPTTCEVERLFSISRHILTYDRGAMTPKQFEEIIFLRANCQYWDAALISTLMARNENAAEIADDAGDADEVHHHQEAGLFEELANRN